MTVLTDRAQAVVATAALCASIASIIVAKSAADQANNTASDSYQLALSIAQTQVAVRTFIGEAPPKVETESPIYSVTNANVVDVTAVWVDGHLPTGERAVVNIGGIQPCTGYTLNTKPHDFEPTALHFFDGGRYRMRTFPDGQLVEESRPEKPKDARLLGSPRTFDASSCSTEAGVSG